MESILASNPLKSLFSDKPLKAPNKPLSALKDSKGVLDPYEEKAPQNAISGSWEDIKSMVESEVDLPAKFSGMEESEDTADNMIALTEFYSNIRNLIPQNQSMTLFGIDDRQPSRSEQDRFKRQLEVIENPRRVMDLLKAGQLSMLEVETLQQFYPMYYQGLVESILEQITGSDPKELNRRQTQQLGILLGVPRVSPLALQQLQEEPQPSESPNVAEAEMSQSQKLEFK